MSKKRLFLSSTDISELTGLSIRSARNMMQYIRTERGLNKQQVISIYDFCYCFHFPIHVIFTYINTDIFVKKTPIDEESVREACQKRVLETSEMGYLYHKDFDLFMMDKELKLRESQSGMDEVDDCIA